MLASSPLPAGAIAGDPARRDEIAALAKRLHELGARAVASRGQDDRAAVYGELLTTCNACHSVARPASQP